MARLRRDWMRNWWGVDPNSASNLANEIERRNARFTRDFFDGERLLRRFRQQVASVAKAAEGVVRQEHGRTSV